MKTIKDSNGTYILEPFKHDCKECKWVGWITQGNKLGNVYICQGKTVLIRYSDEPSDYWSATIGNRPGSISGVTEESIKDLQAREDWLGLKKY